MALEKKVALVLGAVKGIGKGIGLTLAKEGVSVVLTRHDWEDSFEEMEKDFKTISADHIILNVDLRRVEEIKALTSQIEQKVGRLDILINNIERGGWPTVHGQYVEDQWDLEMETTLKSKRWVFDSVFQLLKESQ